jgi:hypothetical protein
MKMHALEIKESVEKMKFNWPKNPECSFVNDWQINYTKEGGVVCVHGRELQSSANK